MITLIEARLVNWHYFADETLAIGNRCLIAGDNGSGKSTIVDAIQYALAADLRKARFNQAAGDRRGGRDLSGYVRCKLGSESTEYLRGDTVAHVMLRFDDGAEGFTAGVCVEAYTDGRTVEHFWIAGGIAPGSIVVRDESSRPLVWRRIRETLAERGAELLESKREYVRQLTGRLGVYRRMAEYNPYLEAFTRSVSFTPLVSVDRFVCDYILDDRPLDIRSMKENLESYKEAERHANATVRRITALRLISESAEEYRKFRELMTHQDYLKRFVDREIAAEDAASCATRAKEVTTKADATERALDENARTRDTLDAAVREIDAALARDDNHGLYLRLSGRVKDLERELERETKRAGRCSDILAQCRALGVAGGILSGTDDTTEKNIDRLHESFENARAEAERKRLVAETARAETEKTLRDYASERQDLERGIRRFPESSAALREELAKRGIEAWILAELAEVTDAQWADATEGWLNTLRFAVIVEPDSFQRALDVYDSLPKTIAGVALPNIAKMRRQAADVRQGSLARLVSTDNPWARVYLDSVLGEVMTADISTLKNYGKAITRECMSYSNHTATRIKEEVWKTHWLGRAAREERMAFLAAEMARLRAERDDCDARLNILAERVRSFNQALRSLAEAQGLTDAEQAAKRLSEELEATRAELAGIDISSSQDLERKRTELARRVDETNRERDRLSSAHGKLVDEAERLAREAERLRGETEDRQRELDAFRGEHEAELSACEAYAAERLKGAKPRDIAATWDAARKGIETKAEKTLKIYRERVQAYNNEFHALVQVEIEGSAEVEATLERLERSELPEYRDRIARARQDAEREFREHFIAKLNEYIIEARESFREINATLRAMTFGRDQYAFSLEERTDRRGQIRAIQQAAEITGYDDGLFSQIVDPAEREATEALFKTIIGADLDSAEMRSICDYRTYFTYDIVMRDTQSVDPTSGKPVELRLSKVLREKSGGEAQTPYYVAIAASFYRFFRDREDSTVRFVMFDEAFDKLDDERIGKVLDLYSRMGIQLLVAVPTEKIESIAPKMDRVNLVIRHGRDARVRPFSSLAGEAEQ
jgi:DNA repair exonuclease SbcCD ATPase subunit